MKEKLLMIVFVLILGSILSTALVSVNAYTAPLIDKNKVRKLQISVLNALGIAYSQDKVDEAFSGNVTKKELEDKDLEFYVAGTPLPMTSAIVTTSRPSPMGRKS